MNSGPKTALLVSLLAIAIAGGWLLSQRLSGYSGAPEHAFVLPEPMELPEFSLLDQDGNTVSAAYFRGRRTLVFFGFTHCPDICPATLQILAAARRQLAADGRPVPDILLISVDPERDTPDTLKNYVGHFGEGVSGATGSIEELRKLTGAIGIYFKKEPVDESTYLVAHSAHVVMIDDDGRYSAVFSAPHTIDAFVSDFPRIAGKP